MKPAIQIRTSHHHMISFTMRNLQGKFYYFGSPSCQTDWLILALYSACCIFIALLPDDKICKHWNSFSDYARKTILTNKQIGGLKQPLMKCTEAPWNPLHGSEHISIWNITHKHVKRMSLTRQSLVCVLFMSRTLGNLNKPKPSKLFPEA